MHIRGYNISFLTFILEFHAAACGEQRENKLCIKKVIGVGDDGAEKLQPNMNIYNSFEFGIALPPRRLI